ncbi:MAG: hypothetical protein LBQ18_05175 [Campylobacteraceae bacterium]|nr:hypothetical protein [Campylobacteraceae bacterium]
MIPNGTSVFTPSDHIVFKAIFLDESDNIIREFNVTKGKSLIVPIATVK